MESNNRATYVVAILLLKNKKYSSVTIDLEDGRALDINRAYGHLRLVRLNVRPGFTLFSLECSFGLSFQIILTRTGIKKAPSNE